MTVKISYSPVRDCLSFWSWLYYDWNYICGKTRNRERGFRIFGFEISNNKCICGRCEYCGSDAVSVQDNGLGICEECIDKHKE